MMQSDSTAKGSDGDLSDFDIHRLMEALQTRQAKSVVSCALSIKVILTQVQQQLLNLMDANKEIDFASYPVDFPSDDPDDADYPVPSLTTKTIEAQRLLSDDIEKDEESDDSTSINTVVNTSTVPITGSFSKLPQKYPCSSCEEVFPTKKALSRHLQTHNDLLLDVSDDNPSSDNQISPLAQMAARPGRRSKGGVQVRVTCTVCGVQTLRQHMARHMLKHTGVKPYHCEVCDIKFARKDKFNEHLRKHEDGRVNVKVETPLEPAPKEHSCRKCLFKTDDKAEFRAHQKSHPSKNSYKCVECDKEFSCPSHLEQHNIKHRSDKPFMCDMCGVSFSREPNLARHIRSHVDPAPYRCKYCEKPYHRQNELVVHERTHTGEKPYMCEICGNGYAATKYLKRHLFTHTGLKPFKCDVCDRAFSRLENMRAHRKIHEKNTPKQSDPVATAFQASQAMDTSQTAPASQAVPANGPTNPMAPTPQSLELYQFSASANTEIPSSSNNQMVGMPGQGPMDAS